MAATKTLKILAEGCPTVPWSELKEYEFNTLKEEEGRDVSRLSKAMREEGFLTPFFVWKRKGKAKPYVLDGAGRKVALTMLEGQGYQIPDLPVIRFKAKNLDQAKKYVLMISSQHGRVTQISFDEFTEGLELDVEEQLTYFIPEVSEVEIVIGGGIVEPEPPDDFPEVGDPELNTQCPKCGFEFDK